MSAPIQHLLRSHPRDLGGFAVRRVLPAGRADGRAVHLLRSDGSGRFSHRHRHRRAPASAHRARHRDVSVRWRDHAPRQPRDRVQPITPGEVNWMTAGRGIVHSERTPAEPRATGRRCTASRPGWRCRRRTRKGAGVRPSRRRRRCPVDRAAGRRRCASSPARRSARGRRSTSSPDALRGGGARARREPASLPPEHEERARLRRRRRRRRRRHALEPGQLAVLAAGDASRSARRASSRADAARRREDGRPALHLVELRLELAGAHRAGEGRLARGALSAGAGRDRADPAARAVTCAEALLHYAAHRSRRRP